MNHPTNHHDVLILDEAHRATCTECSALWHELEQIGADAAKLPPLVPERDLWAGIEARIAAPGESRVPAAETLVRSRATSLRSFYKVAIAASLLVAVSSAVTWQIATSEATPSAAAPADGIASNVDEQTASDLHLAAFQSSVRTMEDEIATLERIVATRRAELDPRTVRVLEQNLQLIDRAIAESREALRNDPASAYLSAQYTRAYSSKLTLLRDVATLPTGI
jgi:hypothetical protein